MNDLPRELLDARRLLRDVTPPTGLRQRVLLGVYAQTARRPTARGRALLAAFLVGASASALGVGVAPSLFRLQHEPQPSLATATGTDRRASSPSPKSRSTALVRGAVAGADSPSEEPDVAQPRPDEQASTAAPTPVIPLPTAAPIATSTTLPAATPIATSTTLPAATARTGGAQGSELAMQVEAYERATAVERVDPVAAVSALRALRVRWPQSALAHEIDLRLVQALLSAGRHEEARREARDFVARYPHSPRVRELEEIAGLRGDEHDIPKNH